MARESHALRHARAEAGSRQMFEDVPTHKTKRRRRLVRSLRMSTSALSRAHAVWRTTGSASDTSNDKVLYRPINTVARSTECCSAEFLYAVACYPHSLSRHKAKPACAEHLCLSGSLNPCPSAVHMTLLHLGLQKKNNTKCMWMCVMLLLLCLWLWL